MRVLFRLVFWIPAVLSLLWVAGCRAPDAASSSAGSPTPTPSVTPTPTPSPAPSPEPAFRRPPRGNQLTGFERLAGWAVSSSTGEASLDKNEERAVWGSYAAEIRFRPGREGPHEVVLTPEEPLVIRSPFNTLLMWALDTGEAMEGEGHAVRLEARDASGRDRVWRLPLVPGKGWDLLHRRETEEVPWPVDVVRLVWEVPAGAREPRTLYLDSLSIYQEVLGRVPREIDFVRPHGYAPAFAPIRDHSVKLDFPLDAHAFRPANPRDRVIRSAQRMGADVFEFVVESGTLRATYRVRAASGGPEVRAWTEAEGDAGGIEWRGIRVHGPADEPELRFARLREGRLWLQYTDGLSFECFPSGGGLRIDAQSLSENVSRFDLGRIRRVGGGAPKTVTPPFLRLSPSVRWPVFAWTTGGTPRMASVLPDWWFSMAAGYQPGSRDEGGISLGQMRYPRRWRGSRNVFRERIYFTLGDRLEKVLPRPAHPGGLYAKRLQHGLLEDPPPGSERGGVPGWRAFDAREAVSMTPTRLLSIRPTHEHWEPDRVARTREGDWRNHPGGGMVLKTGLLHKRPISERIGGGEAAPGGLYEQVLASHSPWRFTDYDARLPGAGTFAQSWVEIGAFLQQAEAETDAPAVARGGATWFWSGLWSGLAPDFPRGVEELHPFLPHVSWYFLHPGTVPLGLGTLEDFRFAEEEEASIDLLADRMLASVIAYGATGRMPAMADGASRRKLWRFQRALHPRLAAATPDRIAYWDGERFLDMARAMANEAWRESRLYLRLADATEIWVNGHKTEDWEVRVDGEVHRLPPFGFVVRGTDLFALSAAVEGGSPLWILETPDTLWIHSPDRETAYAGFAVRGSVQWRRRKGEKIVELTVGRGGGRARMEADRLGLTTVGTVEAENEEGEALSDVSLVREGGQWVLQGVEEGARIRIHPTVRGREKNFVP